MSHSGGPSADGLVVGVAAARVVVGGAVVGRFALVVAAAPLAEAVGAAAVATPAEPAGVVAVGIAATLVAAGLAAAGVEATVVTALDRPAGDVAAAGSFVRTKTSAPTPTLNPITSATSGATRRFGGDLPSAPESVTASTCARKSEGGAAGTAPEGAGTVGAWLSRTGSNRRQARRGGNVEKALARARRRSRGRERQIHVDLGLLRDADRPRGDHARPFARCELEEHERELTGALHAVVGILGECAIDHRFELRRRVGSKGAQRSVRRLEDLAREPEEVRCDERRTGREQLEEHDTERPDVRASVDVLRRTKLLGRHVVWGPEQRDRVHRVLPERERRRARGEGRLRDAEVEDFRVGQPSRCVRKRFAGLMSRWMMPRA